MWVLLSEWTFGGGAWVGFVSAGGMEYIWMRFVSCGYDMDVVRGEEGGGGGDDVVLGWNIYRFGYERGKEDGSEGGRCFGARDFVPEPLLSRSCASFPHLWAAIGHHASSQDRGTSKNGSLLTIVRNVTNLKPFFFAMLLYIYILDIISK